LWILLTSFSSSSLFCGDDIGPDIKDDSDDDDDDDNENKNDDDNNSNKTKQNVVNNCRRDRARAMG
jgi:hypothetical protein